MHFVACQHKKDFFWKIVTGDKKCIMYDNPKITYSCNFQSRSTININSKIKYLCRKSIRLMKHEGCCFHDQVTERSEETVTTKCYDRKLNNLIEIKQKRLLLDEKAENHFAMTTPDCMLLFVFKTIFIVIKMGRSLARGVFISTWRFWTIIYSTRCSFF